MSNRVTIFEIDAWVMHKFSDVIMKKKYGETTYFYNRSGTLPHGVYFLTIKEKDGPNDKSSDLGRSGVFRLSWQLSNDEFLQLFGTKPDRPSKGQAIRTTYDLSALNILMPHSVYGWMGWAMILSPSKDQFDQCKVSITKAYERARRKFDKKLKE